MASEMMEALMALCQERGIDQGELINRLETSLAKSYGEVLHLPFGARVTIDRTEGRVYVYELVPRGEPNEDGEYDEFDEKDVTPGEKDVSRRAAQAAKSEINAMVKTAASERIFSEFSSRIGDLITGTVLQSTRDFTIIKIREGVEAELPHFDLSRKPSERNERPRGERYLHNQRLKAIIIDVRDPNSKETISRGDANRPSIVVSRTHPDLIKELFRLEVPEIYDHVVDVRSIAREPGVRSKVAVASSDSRLDPVGACVGPKGSRVRTVVSELKGERVDVIPWSEDPATFVASALSPARVSRVIVDGENNYATVIVPDDQLSLAIGKEGQNARLAARLTGMHIDIKNESLAGDVFMGLSRGDDLADDREDGGEHRCEYVLSNGSRCRNMAKPGSRFCRMHEKFDQVEVSDEPDSLI